VAREMRSTGLASLTESYATSTAYATPASPLNSPSVESRKGPDTGRVLYHFWSLDCPVFHQKPWIEGLPIARYIMERNHRVCEVDFAEPMLAMARSRFSDASSGHLLFLAGRESDVAAQVLAAGELRVSERATLC
jgi:hypothetical protein